MGHPIDFERLGPQLLARADQIVAGLLPGGRREAREWVAPNPTRADNRLGSFKINLETGYWSDFATGDRGRDLVSLAAYCTGLTQREAAIKLAESVGLNPFQGGGS